MFGEGGLELIEGAELQTGDMHLGDSQLLGEGVLAHRQSNLESSATQKHDTDALVGVLEIAVTQPDIPIQSP